MERNCFIPNKRFLQKLSTFERYGVFVKVRHMLMCSYVVAIEKVVSGHHSAAICCMAANVAAVRAAGVA